MVVLLKERVLHTKSAQTSLFLYSIKASKKSKKVKNYVVRDT